MPVPRFLRAALRPAGRTALASLAIASVAMLVGWLRGWREAEGYGEALSVGGAIAILAGLLSFVGVRRPLRDWPDYEYTGAAHDDLTRRRWDDIERSYGFVAGTFAAGLVTVAIGEFLRRL